MHPEVVPEALAAPLADAWPRLTPVIRAVRYHASVESTMDVAAALAGDPSADGVVVLADCQTGGRGRRGRAWASPPGAGLYFSILVRPPLQRVQEGEPSVVGLLTIATGVAVAEGLVAATGLEASLKWPNDVFSDRKLAGILAEGHGIGSTMQAVVVGVGVNVLAAAYPPDLAAVATSVEAATGRAPDRGRVLAEILAAFAARYRDLCEGRYAEVVGRWRSRATAFMGRPVAWQGPEGPVAGVADGLAPDGALLVRTDLGTHHVRAGEVRWL